MTPAAITLALLSGVLHAGWNYLAKRSQENTVFIWWTLSAACVIYLPMAVYFAPRAQIDANGWTLIIASGVIHFFYFFFLGGSYERGDLSLVYPLSRGAAPVFVTFAAVLLLNEKISLLGFCGIAVVVLGIYTIHLPHFSTGSFWAPLRALKGASTWWTLGTGGTIAAYLLVDKVGVSHIPPPLYIYYMGLVSWLLLTPLVIKTKGAHIRPEWHRNQTAIMAVGVLIHGSYLLTLWAFRLAPASYIVAIREISIVCSVLLGIWKLGERHGLSKTVGAALIMLGVVGIGLAD